MRRWYTLIDNIHNEIKDYGNRPECLEEAERRVSLYKNGYWTGKTYHSPVKAVLIENENRYIVTYEGGIAND